MGGVCCVYEDDVYVPVAGVQSQTTYTYGSVGAPPVVVGPGQPYVQYSNQSQFPHHHQHHHPGYTGGYMTNPGMVQPPHMIGPAVSQVVRQDGWGDTEVIRTDMFGGEHMLRNTSCNLLVNAEVRLISSGYDMCALHTSDVHVRSNGANLSLVSSLFFFFFFNYHFSRDNTR